MADDTRILIGGAVAAGTLVVPTVETYPLPNGGVGVRIVPRPVFVVAPVFGWEIKLDPIEHDIEEAAIVTNLNFHCGRQRAVLDVDQLPGPSSLTV